MQRHGKDTDQVRRTCSGSLCRIKFCSHHMQRVGFFKKFLNSFAIIANCPALRFTFFLAVLSNFLKSWVDDTISFQGRNHHIEDPEEDENCSRDCLEDLGSSKFSTNCRMSPDHEYYNGKNSFNTEDRDGKSQAERKHQ